MWLMIQPEDNEGEGDKLMWLMMTQPEDNEGEDHKLMWLMIQPVGRRGGRPQVNVTHDPASRKTTRGKATS